MIRVFRDEDVKSIVYGSLFYGGGGGGWVDEGIRYAELALEIKGFIDILEPHEVPDDYILVTVSAVGAPAAKEKFLRPIYMIKALEILRANGVEFHGIISSEIGPFNAVNGWIQSAILNVPVIDIPCNGRAHPLGVMGSMGLHKVKNYVSKQAAVGGDPAKGRYVEVFVVSSVEVASKIVREAAVQAGGIVAVARNPVKASYAKRYGAPGALKKAMEVGKVIYKYKDQDPLEACNKALEVAEGTALDMCRIESVRLETRGGFDVGEAILKCRDRTYTLTFVNEFMTLEANGTRIATFPDLIVLMDTESGLSIISADLEKYVGKKVVLGVVPKSKLILGAGVKCSDVYTDIERMIGKEMKSYIRDILIA